MLDLQQHELARFLAEDDGGPVVMLNLLRFDPDGGAARYQDYLRAAQDVGARWGLEALFVGAGLPALAAEQGQSWDAVALVRYPSRRAFADMIASPEYGALDEKRKSGLVEAVLQPLTTAAG